MNLGPCSLGREAIKRAHGRANVAAEYPVSPSRSKFAGDRSLVFNRQIGDTPPRVQSVRTGERVCRTCVDATAAGAAANLDFVVARTNPELKPALRQKEPRTASLLPQVGALAKETY